VAICDVCFHHCDIAEGRYGACRARKCSDGVIISDNYGMITSLALDPIEKKPLKRFFPGSMILSAGSYGCNLRCPFCQNYEISASGRDMSESKYMSPQELADTALELNDQGNIGVAFTYNEPLIGWEYVRDTAEIVRNMKMKTVLVSNGSASERVADEIIPLIDAMNIDLKVFSEDGYKKLGGDFAQTQHFIEKSAKLSHVELTTLIVPGLNDDAEMIKKEASWIAGIDDEIALHVTRYFPRWKMKEPATDVDLVYSFADIARQYLKYVYVGNC
jgi:pyruvate formate lyase activating enzyme